MLNRHTSNSFFANATREDVGEDQSKGRTLRDAMEIAKYTPWLNKEAHEAYMDDIKNSGEVHVIRHGDFLNQPNS